MTDATTVFISYAREDEKAALDLHKRFLNEGFNPWLDKFDLMPGQNWDREIRRAIRATDFLVLCLSDQSVSKRGYLQREFKMALDISQEMLATDIYLVPVRLTNCAVPEELGHLQWVDLFEPGGWKSIVTSIKVGKKQRSETTHGECVDNPISPNSQSASQSANETSTAHNSPSGVQQNEFMQLGNLVPSLPRGITHSSRLRVLLSAWFRLPSWPFTLAGFAMVVAGNLAIVTMRSEKVLETIFGAYDFSGLSFIDNNGILITSLLLGIGYLFVVASLLTLIFREQTKRRLHISFVVTLILALTTIVNATYNWNVREQLAVVVDKKIADKIEGWVYGMLALQQTNGGFRAEMLPGRRTQVWTTAQALTGILTTRINNPEHSVDWNKIWAAFDYIEKNRIEEGGGGWAYFDTHSRTLTEINSWVTVAMATAAQLNGIPEKRLLELKKRIKREAEALIIRQSGHGWGPIAEKPDKSRTYSTLMALWALLEALNVLDAGEVLKFEDSINQGIEWLLEHNHNVYGWVPNPLRKGQTEKFQGLNAHVLFVLGAASRMDSFKYLRSSVHFRKAQKKFLNNLAIETESINTLDSRTPDADVHISGTEFVLEGSTFLWFPWTLTVLHHISVEEHLSYLERSLATRLKMQMLLRWNELNAHTQESFPYVTAENLFCISKAVATIK